MGTLVARFVDEETGLEVPARVQVLSCGGVFLHPKDAILKVGPGEPFFYCHGEFSVDTPGGPTRIVAERGTEYAPAHLDVDVPPRGSASVDVTLRRWTDIRTRGWHPANLHFHYDHNEQRSDERLALDPRVEDLRLAATSILRRWDLPYASNRYPCGPLAQFSDASHRVECGEETRHNDRCDSIDGGYGHVMLLRLREAVEPLSRGHLVSDAAPDYPPLSYACDEAHRQGGVVVWCHNALGREAPVAAALGKVDAVNLFDPYWLEPEYDIWYALLNCGLRLPASTGSDWFICSANRVYAYTSGTFAYDSWIEALLAGRTFITNGPLLELTVDGAIPGGTIEARPGQTVTAHVSWHSHYPVRRGELVCNGRVVGGIEAPGGGVTRASFSTSVTVGGDGWLAARLDGTARDSFRQPVFAHTSPVYVRTGEPSPEQAPAAARFVAAIDRSLAWLADTARFDSEAQRREVVDLFRAAQEVYRGLA